MGFTIVISTSTTPIANLQEKAQIIAHEYGVSSTTLFAIIDSETGGTWNSEQICDDGDGRGLACINKNWFPKEFEQALDPDFSIRFIAQAIKDEREDELFTSCSCVLTVKALGVKIPRVYKADFIRPNSRYPHKGGLVLFKKNHLALIEKIAEEGLYIREGNYKKCSITRRLVKFNDPQIRGYWYDISIDFPLKGG